MRNLGSINIPPDHTALLHSVVDSVRKHYGFELHCGQLLCGQTVIDRTIAEMDTGEGKTAAVLYPIIHFATSGRSVFVATANEYLAERDAELAKGVLADFGLTARAALSNMSHDEKAAAYGASVVYSTVQNFGFDFLRDALSQQHSDSEHETPPKLQPAPDVLIVDEADSILIDEASTPLVISLPSQALQTAQMECFRWAARFVLELVDGVDFIKLPGIGFALTEMGRRKLFQSTLPSALDPLTMGDIVHCLEVSLEAQSKFERAQHYVVQNNEVSIVDEFTGRMSAGRQWSRGIHQAIEAREHVPISTPTAASASITIHDYVSRFKQLSGLTGTATEVSHELQQFFDLRVRRIARHQPLRRKHLATVITATRDEKWDRIVAETHRQHQRGVPVLIGTRTIDASMQLSQRLTDRGIEHTVLNAIHHQRESEVIAQAGQLGRVTVATNMAGRGTDIKIDAIVKERGGMHVIGGEPNLARRIDRQLAGRCARQGEPGTFQQFAACDDELFTTAFGVPAAGWQCMLGAQLIRRAQRLVERKAYSGRQSLRDRQHDRDRVLRSLGLDPVLNPIPEE